LATVLAGFEVNAHRGDAIRADLHRKTATVLAVVHQLGLSCLNTSGMPIIELPLDDPDDLAAVAQFLFGQGIYVTLAAYPLVPRSEVGFRIQVTAANTQDEVDHLCSTLRLMTERFGLQRRAAS
jgi:7-keto-8-aminopelargonate synthetase-like enzyme